MRIRTAFLAIVGGTTLSGAAYADDLPPHCQNPAPLEGKYNPKAPGISVGLKGDFSQRQALAAALAKRYQFVILMQFNSGDFFVRDVDDKTVAALRCDAAVRYVTHNAATSTQ